MILLKSKMGIKIPDVFLISSREDVKKIPLGVPYIFGDKSIEKSMIMMLEYEVLFELASRTGLEFNFKSILTKKGYVGLEEFGWSRTHKDTTFNLDPISHYSIQDKKGEVSIMEEDNINIFKRYIKDCSVYVDVSILKALKVFPIWMDNIEKAIERNINDYSMYDNNLYNKKLDGMYGALKMSVQKRNLIIIDISGSIPRAASSITLSLAKNMAESFFADLLITGSKSTLYSFEEVKDLRIENLYQENGTDNDQVYFRKLLSEQEKEYDTVISFGDYHNPGHKWRNEYNENASLISPEEGKKLNKWKVRKIISLHTTSNVDVTGYASWFDYHEIEYVKDWTKDINSY